MSAVVLAFPVHADPNSGNVTLRTGLQGRVIEPADKGVQPQLDSSNHVQAGYYRLRFKPTNVADASICPRTAFKSNEQFKKWRSKEGDLTQQIFDTKGIWSLTAAVKLYANGTEYTAREIRLIRIENPEEQDCKIIIAGSETGDLAAIDAATFPVPINYTNTVYSDSLNVVLKSEFKMEGNQKRIDALWSGLNLFATTVSAGLGPIVGAVTPIGKTETKKLLDDDVQTVVPISFDSEPSPGERANRVYIHLGFPPLTEPPPASPKGGMVVELDYQASLFRTGQFYNPAVSITAEQVLSAKPLPPVPGAAGGLRTVREGLDANVWDALKDATSISAFDSACTVARPALIRLDLSDVDASLFLWAVASKSAHKEVSGNLDKLACFSPASRADIAKMGVKIVAPPVEGTVATLKDMYSAMKDAGRIMQDETNYPGSAVDAELTDRFADQIRLVLADEVSLAFSGLPDPSDVRSRTEVAAFLATKFSHIGCFAPRESRADLPLPLRPKLVDLPAKGRASAALALSREAVPRPFILSFGFEPAAPSKPAQISTIIMGRRGGDKGTVMQELTVDRRPASCTQTWMDEIFTP
jgi:hypothetical protein